MGTVTTTILAKVEQLEKQLKSLDKGLWSLRASVLKTFTSSVPIGKGRFWGLAITGHDIQEAKKNLFDFDLHSFLTKKDISLWKKRKSSS